ncbi:MAG: hypothetical protein ACD_75C00104G0003 [uncultured bacterium]|nr:MAG: hypothetical protein ACD_75C00104G0003 [uncultured bacterium]
MPEVASFVQISTLFIQKVKPDPFAAQSIFSACA